MGLTIANVHRRTQALSVKMKKVSSIRRVANFHGHLNLVEMNVLIRHRTLFLSRRLRHHYVIEELENLHCACNSEETFLEGFLVITRIF